MIKDSAVIAALAPTVMISDGNILPSLVEDEDFVPVYELKKYVHSAYVFPAGFIGVLSVNAHTLAKYLSKNSHIYDTYYSVVKVIVNNNLENTNEYNNARLGDS